MKKIILILICITSGYLGHSQFDGIGIKKIEYEISDSIGKKTIPIKNGTDSSYDKNFVVAFDSPIRKTSTTAVS